MADTVVRKHIIFYGRVQDVGFRYFSVYKARLLGLAGWVKNLDDGSVEMEVHGRFYVVCHSDEHWKGRKDKAGV